jgi:hypothetical protein
MGWVVMSERELNRVEVLSQVDDGRLTVEKPSAKPEVKPTSARTGYKKTGRRPPGRPSKMEAYYERRQEERKASQGCDI